MIHGGAPYQEVTHVPLIIRSPDLKSDRNGHLGGLIDLMPTVLKIGGVPIPQKKQGYNLFEKRSEQFILSESYNEGRAHSVAIFDSAWKLIKITGFFQYQFMRRLLHFRTNRKKHKRMVYFKYDVLNKGIDPILIKRALLKRYRNDFIGMPPVCQSKCNKILWGKLFFQHFFGKERIELYNREKDLSEKRNLAAIESTQVKRLKNALGNINMNNRRFKENLALKNQYVSIDEEPIKESLRQLGYID